MTKQGVDVLLFNDCTTSSRLWTRTAGPYRIATELRRLGLRVQVVDFFSHMMIEEGLWQTVIDKFVGARTLYVGLSTTFLSSVMFMTHKHRWWTGGWSGSGFNQRAFNMLYGGIPRQVMDRIKERVQRINPSTKMVAGGANVTLRDSFWDVLCMGYGETHIVDYTRWRMGKNPFFQYRTNERGQMILDYDTKAAKFDFVNSAIVWVKEDCVQRGEALPIEISRGCIFKCKFCFFPLNGKSKLDFIKERAVLIDEFVRNYELFGTTRYIFADDTYNDTTAKLEFIDSVAAVLPFKLEFATYARLDLLASHPEQIELLKSNGAKTVMFGIETLNHVSGKAIGKGMDPERLVETLHRVREAWGHDIQVNSGFIVGLPHDTYATMERWLDRITRPGFPMHSFNLAPLGLHHAGDRLYVSDMERDPAKFGYTIDDEGGWTNSMTKTSFRGCDELAQEVHAYAMSTGQQGFPAHQLMSLPGYGIPYQDNVVLGLQSMLAKRPLFNAVNSMFLSYMHDVLNLEEE